MSQTHSPFTRFALILSGLLLIAVGCHEDASEVIPFPGAPLPSASTQLEPEPGDEGGGGTGGGGGAAPEAPRGPRGPDPIAACCNSIQRNMRGAPLDQQGAYLAALGTCQAVRANPQARIALSKIRAQLRGAKIPHTCR